MKKIISPVFTQKTSKFPLGYWWLIEIYRLQMRQSSCFISEVCFKCHRALSTMFFHFYHLNSVQFSSAVQSCLTLCKPMNCSTSGLPVHHQLPEFTQTNVHRVGDAIQPSHPLLSPSPPAPNPSQHQSLFQWVNSSHEVARALEFQLQHHSLQRNPRADLL